MKVLVTAGPTREFLDPVRFLSNRSTGRMGFAVAECARCRGHETVLISGPVSLDFPEGVRAVRVVSALDMLEAVRSELSCGCDAVVMTAAVADWRPEVRAERKLKKEESPPVLKMVRNPDILVETAGLRRGCVCVGFAAETDHVMESAVRKLEKKELDMIVANDVTRPGAGFEVDTNIVTFITASGEEQLPLMTKAAVAGRILDFIERRRRERFGC